MRQFLAVLRATAFLFVLISVAATASAQAWNDPRSLELVNRATTRRAQQLADTGLADYQATAHGYVTFLAQLGEGFLSRPKLIKADELELEVYWHAPNQSKQRIIGRRDTLLLPTDISYHRDHLGIVQNNFPDFIRVGEGDEVRDVPHPLSAAGRNAYDFFLADSFVIGSPAQRIRVYELKVRPKDDRQARVVGAIYLEPTEGQVVRMNLSFTRAAFLDDALEELSIVLENRLVAGRYWLPSQQRIEIRRTGTWLDYPVRGIINGRWEIGDYKFNLSPSPTIFVGPEIVQGSPAQLRAYQWKGAVLDSLPPDVREVADPDIRRVQEEARALVRAQALARAQRVTMSGRDISDFVRANRVEGLALGDGLSKQFGHGLSVAARARYGIDDEQVKASGSLSWEASSAFRVRLFGLNDFRDVGDQQERSGVINTVASQEFGSDYTDPYRVRGGGIGVDFSSVAASYWRLDASVEQQDPLRVFAHPVTGNFEPTVAAVNRRVFALATTMDRRPMTSFGGMDLTLHGSGRATFDLRPSAFAGRTEARHNTVHGAVQATLEREFARGRFVSQTAMALAGGSYLVPYQEMVYLGGPISAPGYDYHSLKSTGAVAQHVEWQFEIPFPSFSLGRFGRVPGSAVLAPYVHGVETLSSDCVTAVAGASTNCPRSGLHPSIGAAILSPFNLLRLDVAKGFGRGGRWTFNVDVSREFWRIL
jgi:hypothetical protein